MDEHRIASVHQMSLEIPFDAEKIEIVAGREEAQLHAARRIAEAIKTRCGRDVPVVGDAGYADWSIRPGCCPIFVGHLGNNRGIEYLYYQWLTFVDKSYPGEGGYVLTTLWNPWGGGTNALIVGAGDGAGLAAGAARFEAVIAGSDGAIGGLHEVVYGSSKAGEEQEAERLATAGPTPDGWVFDFTGFGGLSDIPLAGWAYIRSGDRRSAEAFKQGLMGLIQSPAVDTRESQIHLGFWGPMMMWPLVETSGVFCESERLRIVRFLYDVLTSREGVGSHYLSPATDKLPRQNHGTRCYLGVLFGWAYFNRHYEIPEVGQWRARVDQMFSIGETCSKQLCDENGHGWNNCMGDFVSYALLTGNTAFFDSGMARLAANRAAANCTSNGFVATVGDGDLESHPNWFLAAVAFYLRDPGLRFVVENMALRRDERLDSDWRPWRQSYDGGLAACLPAEHVGTRAFPLDRAYYDIPKNSQGNPHVSSPLDRSQGNAYLALREPNVPFGQTFDILTMRSGWDRTSQYLILDGTGGGSHSYEDANAILTFVQDDRLLLLSPDSCFCCSAPKNHNMVTVTRNGQGARFRSYCRLDTKVDLPTFGLTSTTLPDYIGTDWTRTLLWKKGDFFLVVDRLRALERADYDAVCRWYTPGEAEFAGDACVLHQPSYSGSRTDLIIHNLSGQNGRVGETVYALVDSQIPGLDLKPAQAMGEDRKLLTRLEQSENRTLEAGGQMQFVNLLYARSGARVDQRLDVKINHRGGALVSGSDCPPDSPIAIFLAEAGAIKLDGLSAVSEILAAWRGGLFAAGCTALGVGALSIQFSKPCGLELDASGRLKIDTCEDLAVSWHVDPDHWGQRHLEAGAVHELQLPALSLPDPQVLFTEGGGAVAVAAAADPQPVAAPAPAWTTQAGGRINAVHVAELDGPNLVLAAGQEGVVRAFDPTGREVWSCETGSEVNTIHSGVLHAGQGVCIVLGCEDEFVRALDSGTGKEQWRYRPEFGNQYWPYWSWGKSSIKRVWVDDMDGDGDGEVIVVPGNMRLHLIDADGIERWVYRTDHGTFLRFEVCDIDDDGEKEIIGGCDVLSSVGICRVIGTDGQQKHQFYNAGWGTRTKEVLVTDIDDDGQPEVICAVDREENLRVHSFADKSLRWGRHLGEMPVGLALLPGPAGKVLFVATEGRTALGLDPNGSALWTLNVAPGAERVIRMRDAAAVVCANGRILRVTGDGKAEMIGAMPAKVTAGTFAAGQLAVACKDGTLSVFETS